MWGIPSPKSNQNGGFMPQAQVKQFPGYGVVYPDGVSGVKVVGTFTQGPSKTVNPDGSVAYTTPAPTIHELFGGGFAYASGERVTKREHLEGLPGSMRERALKWFDSHGEISVAAKEDIPPLNLDKKQRPEPIYVLSSDLPPATDEVSKGLDKVVHTDQKTGQAGETELQNSLASIAQAISSLATIVKEQGEQIAKLSGGKPDKKGLSKQSEVMKAKWADPEWRARRGKKNG